MALMKNRVIKVRKSRLQDQGQDDDLRDTTPAERLAMLWPLTLSAWSFTGEPRAKSRLQRHIVHIQRRKG
jgi:hypothetical protein